MKKSLSSIFLVSMLALPMMLAGHGGPAQQQVDWNAVEVKVEKVAGNVWMLSNDEAGNIGVSVGEDGVLIVDDQFAPLAAKIKDKLKGISSGKLKFVLNTHYHGDHTGGNKEFGPEAPIIAHDNVRKRLVTLPDDPGRRERWVRNFPKEAWPVITFGDRVSIHFNGEEIKVIHFPHGHTDGDSIIFFPTSNVVHMGDDFFAGRFPYVDLESGGNVQGLTKNIEQVLSKLAADVKIIPGHGPVSTLDDLRAFHHMLVATADIVSKRKAAGMSLEDAKKAGLPGEWESWGTGYINADGWITTLYNSPSQ